jgi:molybdopterin-synthase adenylyltransferase
VANFAVVPTCCRPDASSICRSTKTPCAHWRQSRDRAQRQEPVSHALALSWRIAGIRRAVPWVKQWLAPLLGVTSADMQRLLDIPAYTLAKGEVHPFAQPLSPPYVALMDLDFTEDEIRRYSRHILLAEVGGTGQAKLKAARVLIIGAGGLGSPLLLYLAAAGIGTIGIVDHDTVELSNLQRQIAHATVGIGRPKAESAAATAHAINPDVEFEIHATRLTADNALDLVSRYDVVCDGTDNFPTRFLTADACVLARRTLVSAAVLRFDGQLSVFKPHEGGPCYRCLYPEPPPPGLVPTCSEAGVLGAVTGVMGTLQATEVLKEILGVGETLAGKLLVWDALATRFRTVKLPRDPDCALCGPQATIRDLSAHADAGAPACAL